MDIEQYNLLQKDVVSSFHERLNKGEKIVRGFFDVLRPLDLSNSCARNTWSLDSKRVSRKRKKSTKPRQIDRSTSRARTIKNSKKPFS